MRTVAHTLFILQSFISQISILRNIVQKCCKKDRCKKGFYVLFVSSLSSFLSLSRVLNSNRPFPSFLVPLLQNESKCETFLMKMSSACSFIFMQIKVIFHKNGFALRLALKQRHKGTRKWAISVEVVLSLHPRFS